MAATIVPLCKFVHEAQRERGLAMLCSGPEGDTYADAYRRQNGIVDAAWRAVTVVADLSDDHIEQVSGLMPELARRRAGVLKGKAETGDLIAFYSRSLIEPALEAAAVAATLDPLNDPSRVSAFVNLLKWKERVGQVRAVGAAPGEDGPAVCDRANRLKPIVAELKAYERTFLALCGPAQRQHYDGVVGRAPEARRVNAIEGAIAGGDSADELKKASPEAWFDLISTKMDMLQQVVLYFADNLAVAADGPNCRVVPRLPAEIQARLGVICDSPLFAGLSEQALGEILSQGRIVSHPRGAVIFLHGEPVERFYLVLQGWVKLLKGNAEGEESVFEVLTTGDGFPDTVIFKDAIYPVTAQAVEAVELLSLPASVVRERVKNDQEFALNMLAAAANRSKALISQFEQLTLKKVTERVGRFLLKQFIAAGDSRTTLELPLEKSVIASYLGMKPETFSRTLQALREEGIDINRNVVTLPDTFALCTYCDVDLATTCFRKSCPECPFHNET